MTAPDDIIERIARAAFGEQQKISGDYLAILLSMVGREIRATCSICGITRRRSEYDADPGCEKRHE